MPPRVEHLPLGAAASRFGFAAIVAILFNTIPTVAQDRSSADGAGDMVSFGMIVRHDRGCGNPIARLWFVRKPVTNAFPATFKEDTPWLGSL
jgi:hypothetical protein